MAKEDKAEHTRSAAQSAVRPRRFGAPDQLPAECGLVTQDDPDLYGVVATENIRSVLDAFGLPEKREIVIPFHHIAKRRDEMFSLRIDPLGVHQVDGKPVMGHSWAFIQQLPERVRPSQ